MFSRLVLVDVDTGTDDALALLLLLAADQVGEVKLLGITCVAGNTSLANVCRNTLRLLRAANRLDVSPRPVFQLNGRLFVDPMVARSPYLWHDPDGIAEELGV